MTDRSSAPWIIGVPAVVSPSECPSQLTTASSVAGRARSDALGAESAEPLGGASASEPTAPRTESAATELRPFRADESADSTG